MAVSQDERQQQATAYISHNAAKGHQEVLKIVTESHEQLMESIAGLSQEQATFKFATDEWPVLEVLTHMLELKRAVVDETCQALSRGELPEPATSEITNERMTKGFSMSVFGTLEEASAEAEAVQQALDVFLSGVSGSTNTEFTQTHPFFGAMNCLGWAVYLRVHELMHADQIAQIKAAEAYPK